MMDDSALAYKTDKGLIIITGCSHSGIGLQASFSESKYENILKFQLKVPVDKYPQALLIKFILPFAFANVTGNFSLTSLFNYPGIILCLNKQCNTRRIKIYVNTFFCQVFDFHSQLDDFHMNIIGTV